VEEVARDKLVAELLDRVCERGYLRIGDLRDAVARNRLKLGDLEGVSAFIGGDALLRADTRLAYALDGVYRRGEFYLRWIHRFVGLFFGTPWGRALTLYLAVPFGGAFLTLMFAEELRHMGGKIAAFVGRSLGPKPARPQGPPIEPATPPGAKVPEPTPPPAGSWRFDEEEQEYVWVLQSEAGREALAKGLHGIFTSSARATPEQEAHHASLLIAWPTILGFGVFLLLVFHVPPFRRAVFTVLGHLWRAVRAVLWDLPRAVWASPLVRAIRLSSTARYLRRHCATPLLLSLLLLGILFLFGLNPWYLAWYGWVVFVGLLVIYNLPEFGRLQDQIAEALSTWWRLIRVNFLPGLFGAIVDAFRALANWVERKLYAVDEWMRFRSGDSQGSLVTKALLGLLWFPIAYVTRFMFYLLVEPQVNPVKHFPVVTVSHKVIWPMVPGISEWLGVSELKVGMVVNGIPGIFGFIAWELKENWRLYRANCPPVLKPVMIGSHGESMRGLLRPGFHSGTVPKLYRKARRAQLAGNRARAAAMHHELEHTAEGVHRFVEREMVPLLQGCPAWGGVAVAVAAVRFGVQRAEFELAAPALGRDPFVLALENIGGAIEASVVALGWVDKLTDAQRAVLVFALRGLFDMSAAARFDDRARSADALEEPGLGALLRPVPLAEWCARWDATRTVAAPPTGQHA
jgi:hypothetical protein